MNNKNNYNNIIPVISYDNAEINKLIIYKQNKNKSGIYRWNNLITNKSYIGSAKCLRKRLVFYYSPNYLNRTLKITSSSIYSSILKYGYSNFSLDILEYCDIQSLLEKEQYYINSLKPEYNILKRAGSRLGIKHTENTINLLRISSTGRKHTEEAKIKMRELGILRGGLSKENYVKIKIKDLELGIENIFVGNKKAAEYLNISRSTLYRYRKCHKLIKDRYLISDS